MIYNLFALFISFLITRVAYAEPIVDDPNGNETEFAILFARTHLDALLAICAEDKCNFSPLEKDWLRTTRELSQNMPEVVFKNKIDLGARRFLRLLIENQVWINKDLLWSDSKDQPIVQISKAATLWMDILLEDKDISRPVLAILEFELEGIFKRFITPRTNQ